MEKLFDIKALLFSSMLVLFSVLPAKAAWQISFEDNFDGSSLDQTKWNPTGWVDNDYELQAYRPENVEVSGGTIKLWAKKESYNGKSYTSGKITTGGQNASDLKFAQKYGRFECRMKLPKGKGMWPAFWLLNANPYSWPPEIDIVENWGTDNAAGNRDIVSGVWCGGGTDCTGSNASKTERRITSSVDPALDFHVYAMEWDSTKHVFFFDNTQVGTVTNPVLKWNPMWVLLQLAICGAGWCTNPDAGTVFPACLEADYVRVYSWSNATAVKPFVKSIASARQSGPAILFDLRGNRIGQSAAASTAYTESRRIRSGVVLAVPVNCNNGTRTTLAIR
jgi:beta-glucanase (GH16 family)